MNEETKDQMLNTLRSRNHDLIEDNATLYIILEQMEARKKEQDRYVNYLETLLIELGWNPNKEHTC